MNVICVNTTVLGNILKKNQKTPQSDFPNFIGIYISEYTLCFLLLEITKSSICEFKTLISH